MIEKSPGYKTPKIIATSNRNEMQPQRQQALEQWAEYLENLTINNVISINDQKTV